MQSTHDTVAHHAALHHNALTTTHAQAQPHAAAPVQQVPHSSPRLLLSTKHPGTANFADQPVYGLAKWETAQTPLPEHTHASQNHSRTQPQQIGGTEQMEA